MRANHTNQLAAGLLALALLLALARPVQAAGGAGEFEQVVDGYQVHLTFPDGLRPGVTPVQVHLADEHGGPVGGAQVNVVHTYLDALVAAAHEAADGHGGGDTHGSEADTATDSHAAGSGDDHAQTESGGQDESVPHAHDTGVLFQLAAGDQAGAYTGTVVFFEAGQYAVNVVFTIDGQAHTAQFVVDVRAPDAGGAVLAVFAGLNVAIIGAAAVIKRKSAA